MFIIRSITIQTNNLNRINIILSFFLKYYRDFASYSDWEYHRQKIRTEQLIIASDFCIILATCILTPAEKVCKKGNHI